MTFRWVFLDAPGSVTGQSESFATRQEAEDWMGTEWRRLLEEGSLAATLMEGEEELYTMGLTD